MRRLILALTLLLLTLPALARAQDVSCDAGDPEVHDVDFTGNVHFGAGELGNAIITTPSSWARRVLHLPIGPRHCLDTLEVLRDAVRLRLYYRQRGFFKTAVTATIDTSNRADPDDAAVTFHILEGPPTIIDTLTVTGLDSVAPQLRDRLLRFLAPFRNGVYNRVRLQSAIDSIVLRLQNSGYAHATQPLYNADVVSATDRASVSLTFITGKIAHIGRIDYEVIAEKAGHHPAVDTSTLRKLLSFRPGELYRQRDLLRTQRDLYGLETFQHVDVEVPDSLQTNDTSLTVLVRVGEAKMKSMRVGGGWATLDCLRAQARFTDRDFLGDVRRLDLTGRLSHIALCESDVRQDTAFSRLLNYFANATLRFPALLGVRNVPSLSVYSERTSEFRTYIRYTPIGAAVQVTRDLQPRNLRPGLPLTLTYSFEYGRTKADPAVFCQIFNRCTLADVERLQENSALHLVSLAVARDRTNDLLNPSRGSLLHLELLAGIIDTGYVAHFNRVFGEASFYHPVGRSVLAGRLQLGTVLSEWSVGGDTSFVPPQERLYAGGPNSVRGFSQNLLGPVVYIVDSAATRDTTINGTTVRIADDTATIRQYSPTGGNTLVVGNLEWRTPAPFLRQVLQLAAFVDAGLVWNRPRQTVTFDDIKVTPGIGVRVNSPVGPFRVDVAYNRYPLPAGAAYIVNGTTRALECVSPTSMLVQGQLPAGGSCPETFVPAQRSTLFSRLTFNFSIGQAF